MPYYLFVDQVGHSQEVKMSFSEHEKLEKDSTGTTFIECNVKYGDPNMPHCPFQAMQVYDKNVGFPGFETARS